MTDKAHGLFVTSYCDQRPSLTQIMRGRRPEREDRTPFRHIVTFMISKAHAFQGFVLFSGKTLSYYLRQKYPIEYSIKQ